LSPRVVVRDEVLELLRGDWAVVVHPLSTEPDDASAVVRVIVRSPEMGACRHPTRPIRRSRRWPVPNTLGSAGKKGRPRTVGEPLRCTPQSQCGS